MYGTSALRENRIPFETAHHGGIGSHYHCLLPTEVVFKTFYVVFAEVIAGLRFHEDHIFGAGIKDPVFRILGNLYGIARI